jgi:hypothetical protein
MSVDAAGHATPGSPIGSRSRMSLRIAHGGRDDRPAREGCSEAARIDTLDVLRHH